MIKRHIINKAEVAFWAALVLCSSYMLKVNLVLAVLLFSFWAYLKFTQKNLTRYTLLKLSLLFMIIFGLGYFFMYQGWPRWYLPVSAVAMLSAIIFNSLEISLLLSTASALALVVIFKNDFHLGALFLVSAILSSILVKGVRRRSAIIRAGFLIGAVQAATLLLIEGFRVYLPQRYSMLFLNGVISSVAAVGLLPIFEYLFDTVTNISLLELADLSSPLMQRMVIEAPGTYHHSLVVGNLSEAAAHSVGAHELLARVGSYYHDIGKLFKPDYFSENQNIEQSKHDNLTPTISKMVIMN
ncbi:MAG: HDIG domain-containing protein, partial [Candidatus Omnitrophica bacterium]|nr:HDIG domain-containing protein [Candidatus Omnitrophota bacterium]